jgi:hypothetical protein
MSWARQTTPIAKTTYKSWVQKLEEKRSLEKPVRKWEDNIKTDLIYDVKVLTRFICYMIRVKVGIL